MQLLKGQGRPIYSVMGHSLEYNKFKRQVVNYIVCCHFSQKGQVLYNLSGKIIEIRITVCFLRGGRVRKQGWERDNFFITY